MLPIIKYFIDIIAEMLFVFQYKFFYQFHINFNLLLFEEILPYLILAWLISEMFICPCIIKARLSKRFKNFILSYIMKKKFDHFEFNSIKYENKRKQSKEKKTSDEIYVHFTPKLGKNESHFNQERIKYNNNPPDYNISNFLRKFSNIFNIFLLFFSNFFSNLCSLWRGK